MASMSAGSGQGFAPSETLASIAAITAGISSGMEAIGLGLANLHGAGLIDENQAKDFADGVIDGALYGTAGKGFYSGVKHGMVYGNH